GRHLEGVRQRVAHKTLDELRVFRGHPLEGLFLRDPHDRLRFRERLDLRPDGIDLRFGGLGGLLEEHLDDHVLADVVGPRVDPGEEGDEQTEQEHPDQDSHRRGNGRREVRADGAERLAEEKLGSRHYSVVYWPRRSSRMTSPLSSAITRFPLLSTISRPRVPMPTVVS